MYTQTTEVPYRAQPRIFDTLKTPNNYTPPNLADLQPNYLEHQKALLKELHIKDKTHALHDPAQYVKFLTWQVVERCFDRMVWSEARPTHDGKGYSTSAHCAVFRTNSAGHMEPTFWARVSYATQTDAKGHVLYDQRGNPVLEPDAHTIETDLQGLKRRDRIEFRFCQRDGHAGVQAQQFQRMGHAVLLDELDTMRYVDTLANDVLHVVRELDSLSQEEREGADRLARIATGHLVTGPRI
ncbi:MAG TPA: hypothetical protein VJ843_05395 [Candidatus Saccharimonadales bacterium]|nr:hypothetical protein [Candidatus Saccharimonadales bacterium]